jgi:hypothetical protein
LTLCHKPVAYIGQISKNIVNMVVMTGSVHGAKESWFACGKDEDHLTIESNHELREGEVIGEFAGLPPNTDYVVGMFAKNDCGETFVLSTRQFRTPPAFRR